MGIMRIFKAFKGVTDKYEASFKCNKDLESTLNFIRKYQGKSIYRAGKLRVAKDVNHITWHEIELQVQARNPATKQVVNVVETIAFHIFYYQNVTTQITLYLDAVDSKATFADFKKALDKLPDVKGAADAPAPAQEEKLDLSDKTMAEVLAVFEEAINEFGASVNKGTFAKVKTVKAEISKKIAQCAAKEKAAFMASMSKIDMFINAIDMQLAHSTSSAATFAGTYVSQMLAEVAQMQALC